MRCVPGLFEAKNCCESKYSATTALTIVLMHRGRVIESGAADTFFADPRTEEARRFMRGELLV
jgi:ABC-type phosphate transport system ATPase subunit